MPGSPLEGESGVSGGRGGPLYRVWSRRQQGGGLPDVQKGHSRGQRHSKRASLREALSLSRNRDMHQA